MQAHASSWQMGVAERSVRNVHVWFPHLATAGRMPVPGCDVTAVGIEPVAVGAGRCLPWATCGVVCIDQGVALLDGEPPRRPTVSA
jgi:hypothetical protein